MKIETAAPAQALPCTLDAPAAWTWVAARTQEFARRFDIEVRDMIVLLPLAQHLPLARAAWSRLGEALWLPRFETTQTLAAASAAPRPAVDPQALNFDAVADRLQAARLLAAAAPAWSRRDARGFESAVERLVETTQDLARARLALPASARDPWLDEARSRLAAGAGPGAQERALARLALEWSATADAGAADALHALAPAGWVALRAGAVDPLAASLLSRSAAPALWLDARVTLQAPFAEGQVQAATCTDLEEEAQRSAAQVLAHLARGEQPVALIALDRVLVRRVRALLERQQVPIDDETGWKLSTTRAGATVAGFLRAARPRASTDELLDWLKSSGRDWPGLDVLEAAWRRGAVSASHRVDAVRLDAPAAALWGEWLSLAGPLRSPRRQPLSDWLAALRAALQQGHLWSPLLADAAGAQVLEALRLRGEPSPAWSEQAAGTRFDAAEFGRWIESVLEQVAFKPIGAEAGFPAPVVITPLARAMLRPFAAVVCPGADDKHLGAPPPPQPLLGDALAQTLGLPGGAEQRAAEEAAFAQLLRAPAVTLLHRGRDGGEPLQPSPLLLRLRFAAERTGRPLTQAVDPRRTQTITAQAVRRPAPRAAALLPDALDATAYEALRACPYRFFAQRMLRLDEAEELDDALEKRDYGTWLHAVLQAFHSQRDSGEPDLDAELLRGIAAERQALLGRDDADFLPYAVWFEQLVPRYLELLHREEAAGLRVRDTELTLKAEPAALAGLGLALRGRLDRVDQCGAGPSAALRIIDYKTSGDSTLRDRLKQPLEDTQLPFYAALMEAAQGLPAGGVEAAYLALDGREGVALLPHADVQASAAALLQGIAADYARLRAGAALPALGEGQACEHCNARGLCRRDHWGERPNGGADGP